MKKKFLLAALGLAAVAALSLGVAACGGEGGDWTVEKVYLKARSCGYRGTVAELKAELAAHAITDLGTTENGADHEHVFPEWTVVLEPACDSIGISFRRNFPLKKLSRTPSGPRGSSARPLAKRRASPFPPARNAAS